VVVNGVYIYSLVKNRPIVIDLPTNPARVVVTDGFHITCPFDVRHTNSRTYYFKIVCAIEDSQLLVGGIIVLLLYAMGATSGTVFLQLLSLAPIIYFLIVYYIRRKEFIQVRQL
jgi:uncharacterized membrane protein SirB2